MTAEDARRLALALPDTVEQDHHGRPSFRVAGKIFATVWDERTMNVMVDEPGIHTAVAEHPDWCSERYWGKRLAAVAIDLPRVPERELRELLSDAWERKSGRPAG
ncbi:MAG: MmcQ/YjbR family DNA-binding protein [Solirubrobacteraceae bacterium]